MISTFRSRQVLAVPIETLSADSLQYMLSFLHPFEMGRVSNVSKQWNQIIIKIMWKSDIWKLWIKKAPAFANAFKVEEWETTGCRNVKYCIMLSERYNSREMDSLLFKPWQCWPIKQSNTNALKGIDWFHALLAFRLLKATRFNKNGESCFAPIEVQEIKESLCSDGRPRLLFLNVVSKTFELFEEASAMIDGVFCPDKHMMKQQYDSLCCGLCGKYEQNHCKDFVGATCPKCRFEVCVECMKQYKGVVNTRFLRCCPWYEDVVTFPEHDRAEGPECAACDQHFIPEDNTEYSYCNKCNEYLCDQCLNEGVADCHCHPCGGWISGLKRNVPAVQMNRGDDDILFMLMFNLPKYKEMRAAGLRN